MLFSERFGHKPIKTKIQTDAIDIDLRNGLWNCLSICYWNQIDGNNWEYEGQMRTTIKRLWIHFFKEPVDEIPLHSWMKIYGILRNYFFKAQWHDVYSFIEFIPNNYEPRRPEDNEDFIRICNNILEQELSGFRFIGMELTPITSDEELSSIETALKNTNSLKAVKQHLTSSLALLSDRKDPDHRNSIKESISAVESICILITKDKKATLGQALRNLEDAGIEIHPSLSKAFEKMYGYTSDADGIRHALLDEKTLKLMDSKFMLVSCSAFINLLIEKANEAKISLN